MRIGLKLKPGQSGTKKLLSQYGKRLVCVRYRYDERRKKRYKTVELIVEEMAWTPKEKLASDNEVVGVQVAISEIEVQEKIRRAGGKWNRARKLWEMRYDRAVKLGLKSRVRKLKTI